MQAPVNFICGLFFLQKGKSQMHLTLIKNPDESKRILYRIARLVYAETNASSLAAVEALSSMIANACRASKRPLNEIAGDETLFESLGKDSPRRRDLMVDANRRDF
jgi:hypothetical protein